MDHMYQDGSKEESIVNISAKTIFYLMKSLSNESKVERKRSYMDQVKAECGIARDCVDSAIRAYIIEAHRRLNLPEN